MLDVILNTLPVFLAIAVGYIFTRKKILPENASDTIAAITFKLIGPFMIFHVLYGFKVDFENIHLVISPIIVQSLMIVLAILVSKVFRFKNKRMGAVILCMIVFGGGSVYPFVTRNFSNEVFQNFMIVDILQFLLFLITGPIIASYLGAKFGSAQKPKVKDILKSIFTDPFLITLFITFALTYIDVELPEKITDISGFFAGSFSLMMSLFVGTTVKLPNFKSLFKSGSMYVLRVAAMIGIVTGISFILTLTKGDSVPLYLAFFPQFSALSVVYAKDQNLDHEFASQMVLFSMLAQMVVYPVVIAVM